MFGQGSVYNNDQGKGDATTFSTMDMVDLAYKQKVLKAKGQAAKLADKRAGAKMSNDFLPDGWLEYSAETTKMKENLMDEGAKLMTDKGINNLWTDTSPEALDWKKKMIRLKSQLDGVEEAEAWWNKSMASIRTDPNKYHPDYIAAVRDFAKNNPIDNYKNGTVKFPTPKKKNPLVSTVKETHAVIKQFKESLNTEDFTPEHLEMMSEQLLADPKMNEEGGFISGIREEYNALDPTAKRMMVNQNAHRPNGGLRAFIEERIASMSSAKRIDSLKEMNAVAKEFARKKTVVEDSSGETVNVEKVENADKKKDSIIRSIFRKNPGQLRLEVQEGLYGNPNDTPKENMDAAAKYYKDKFDFGNKFSKTREGSGASDKEVETTGDLWMENLMSSDDTAFQNAADKMTGFQMPDGTKIEKVERFFGKNIGIVTTSPSKFLQEQVEKDGEVVLDSEGEPVKQGVLRNGKYYYAIKRGDKAKETWLRDVYKERVKKGKKELFKKDFRPTDPLGLNKKDPLGLGL